MKNPVKGKVTLDTKPISGNVVFLGSDNKELSTLATGKGEYLIDLPPGDYKVAIRGMMGGGSAPPTSTGSADTAKPAGDTGSKMPQAAAGPPAKYADVATSGLDFKHPGGKQTKDWPLTEK